MLIRSTNYYYYNDDLGDDGDNHQTWILTLVDGSGGMQLGRKLRLINKRSGQFPVPRTSGGTVYLTADGEYGEACARVLERT
jgi:hypothetical protein